VRIRWEVDGNRGKRVKENERETRKKSNREERVEERVYEWRIETEAKTSLIGF
jgi:hypothetical protein